MYDGLEILGSIYNFPNKDLEKNISTFLDKNDDKNYNNVIEEMEKTTFLVPLLSNKSELEGLVLINNMIPVFSSIDEFSKVNIKEELNFLFYTINEICSVIKEGNYEINGFIIDPLGINMEFNKELIELRD